MDTTLCAKCQTNKFGWRLAKVGGAGYSTLTANLNELGTEEDKEVLQRAEHAFTSNSLWIHAKCRTEIALRKVIHDRSRKRQGYYQVFNWLYLNS